MSNPNNLTEENEGSIPESFVIGVLDFINFCIDILKRAEKKNIPIKFSSEMAKTAHSYLKSLNPEQVIMKFINKSHDVWEKCLLKKREDLYSTIKTLFTSIPPDMINSIFEIFDLKVGDKLLVTEEDDISMWDYLYEFIRTSIYYVHEKREWGTTDKLDEEGKPKIGYRKVYESSIKLKSLASKFDVALDYSV
jgi:hypothetical protein